MSVDEDESFDRLRCDGCANEAAYRDTVNGMLWCHGCAEGIDDLVLLDDGAECEDCGDLCPADEMVEGLCPDCRADRGSEEDDGDGEPEEGDYTTEDYRTFYQHGTPVVTVPGDPSDDDWDWRPHVRAHMDQQQFWPNVFFVSDHGNAHLLTLEDAR